jgi:NAD(P)H-hydrate epimerase
MKILTAQQMRVMDRLTVERTGISYAALMETAGAKVVEAIIGNYGPVEGKTFAVFCGKGNNGGDGAVIARLLWLKGAWVRTILLGKLDETKGEARANFEIIRRLSDEARRHDRLRIYFTECVSEIEEIDAGYHFVIDALFGTGLARPVGGIYERAIEEINLMRIFEESTVVSVDIPSGLSSDSGAPIGPHVYADLTVTFTSPKPGNILPQAAYANGDLVLASIGTPDWLIEEESDSRLYLVEEKQIVEWLLDSLRSPDAHKGSVGDVLLIAGSPGKTGAAALASESVLLAGAGLVTVATAKSAQPLLVAQAKNEVMTEALDELESGSISHTALDHALRLADKRTVIALGPGLSSSDESTRGFVREFIRQRTAMGTAPLVIDADGLNALAPWPQDLRGSEESPIIITPHPGEMARLIGKTSAEVVADRIEIARDFASAHEVIVVLKGSRSIIASPGGDVYVNPTGNAGMATAGAGDVLTGLIAGLAAQSPREPLPATIAAVYLHGLAGDIAANKLGMRSLLASDIIENLSEAILEVGEEAERGQSNSVTSI